MKKHSNSLWVSRLLTDLFFLLYRLEGGRQSKMKGLLLLWTHDMQIPCGFLVRSLGLQGYDFLDAEPQPKFQGFKNFVYASCGAT